MLSRAVRLRPRQRRAFSTDAKVRPKVLILSGCTAVGKSRFALKLAKELNGALIGADSVKVYQGFDVGSNQIIHREAVPCYLIGHRDSRVGYSVGDYYAEAVQAIDEIVSKNMVPIVVGGTALYLRWLIYGRTSAPRKNPEVYNQCLAECCDRGWDESLQILKEIDPEYANTLTKNQFDKMARAFEVYKTSGKPISAFKQDFNKTLDSLDYDFRAFSLTISPRVKLYSEIDARCERMVEAGLLREIGQLFSEGRLPEYSPAALAVGYRQGLEFLCSGDFSKERFYAFMDTFQSVSRHLAQSQIKWFRKDPIFHWLDVESPDLLQIIKDVYQLSFEDYLKYRTSDEFVSMQHNVLASMEPDANCRTYKTILRIFNNKEAVDQQLQLASEVYNQYIAPQLML